MRTYRYCVLAPLVCKVAEAGACTVCDSAVGQQVRAGILDGRFMHMLMLTALPFPILAIASVLIFMTMPDIEELSANPQSAAPAQNL